MSTVVCWDFDGTLVHSESLWSGSLLRALGETAPGLPVTLAEIKKHTATGFTWHTPEQNDPSLIGEAWWTHMNRRFQDIFLALGAQPSEAAAATQKVRPLIKRKEAYSLYEDTLEALQNVRDKGGTNVLLTNNYPDLDEVIEALGLMPYFDKRIVSAQVGYDKPRPEIFALAKAAYPQSQRFLMVGDNLLADIAGGHRAGMITVLVHQPPDSRADYCSQTLLAVGDLM